MSYSEIRYETDGRVAKVTLNRPRYRNPIGRITIEELDDAFAQAVADDQIRAIVLCAEGPHFSAGHDLGTPEMRADVEARPWRKGARGTFERSWELYIEPGFRWRNLPKPTIAAVQGKCIWGGWMVVAAMDVVFASDDAQFLASNLQWFSMPWDVGAKKAKEILFEPRFIGAVEAREHGFVNRVYPASDLIDETMGYAARVAENDSFTLRMLKVNVNLAQDIMGYASHVLAAHTKPGMGDERPVRAEGGPTRLLAPVERAERNHELTTGI